MKNYTIVLLPDSKFSQKVSALRKKLIGTETVDGMPPHVTLKRRFWGTEEVSEKDIIQELTTLSFNSVEVNFFKTALLNDAQVLIGQSPYLQEMHKMTVDLLLGKVETKNPEWESDGFQIHLTLIRKYPNKINFITPVKVFFTDMCLYEIDPSPKRSYAKLIESIPLKH